MYWQPVTGYANTITRTTKKKRTHNHEYVSIENDSADHVHVTELYYIIAHCIMLKRVTWYHCHITAILS